MNNGNLILTIAIPTYNRKEYLKECLEHVILQIEQDVEVLVCDNASNDGTCEFMKEYCNKYTFIKYLKNETNIGPDGNFLRCLKEGQGQYIHLLSDDDILLEGSVKKIKECILSYGEVSFIYLNSTVFQGQFELSKCKNKTFNDDKNILFVNKNLFVEKLGVYATFVSAMIFNKKIFDNIYKPEQYIGTYLLQTHILFQTVSIQERAIFIANTCIAERGDNSGGYSFYKVFSHNWKNVLFDAGLKNGYQIKSLKKIYSSTIRDFLRPWTINMKINPNNYDSTGYWLLFKETYNYPSAWIYLYPFVIMSPSVYSIIKKIYRRIRYS